MYLNGYGMGLSVYAMRSLIPRCYNLCSKGCFSYIDARSILSIDSKTLCTVQRDKRNSYISLVILKSNDYVIIFKHKGL